jgi:hypothetical protein
MDVDVAFCMTRWFTTDFSLWFDMALPGLQSVGLPIPLGGTSNHFHFAALLEVGGWDAFNVKDNHAVIFDLFNEPFPDNNGKTELAWNCWRSGTGKDCPLNTAGLSYDAAGMQDLVNAVRDTGATNIIMLSGIQYGATLDLWANYKPHDPLNQTAVAWHVHNKSLCNTSACWNTEVLPVMTQYPVIAAEIGEDDQQGLFVSQVMDFLDSSEGHPQSYLAWAWNTDQTVFNLITDYTHGRPTISYGTTYKEHLLLMRQ